jgi:diguanylate cyclase (GGDEF)-like protein/PAS domain S-box-containing protein
MTQSAHNTNKSIHSERTGNTLNPRKRVRNSINAKFLAITLPLVIVTTLILTIFFAYRAQKTMQTELDLEIQTVAQSFGNTVDNLVWNYQIKELNSALIVVSSNPDIIRAEIFTQDGNLLLADGVSPELLGENSLSVHQKIFHIQPAGSRFKLGELILHYSYANTEKLFLQRTMAEGLRLLLVAAIITISAIFAYRRTIGIPLSRLLSAIQTTHESGKWTMADWNSSDEIGKVISAHNSLIGDIAKKEKDLSENEHKYRQLFDNAQAGIINTRPDGTVLVANQTSANILGFDSIEELMAENATQFYTISKDRQRLWELLEKNRKVSNFRTRIKRKGGSNVWVEFSGRLDADNCLNGIMVDISKRMEADQVLKERDELHRAFFDENKAVMLLHDPKDSTIQFANPAACKYYGYSKHELTSMNTSELCRMSDEEIFAEMHQASMKRQGYFNFVHAMKDGSLRDVEVYTGPISLGNRQLHYSIIHDVTEKRRLERKLERMATTDQLTGSLNRHALFSLVKEELVRTRRYGHPLAVLMFDLDHFKLVNDTYGHAVGDKALRLFALTCRAELRDTDMFGRLGGEEFAAMLVETNEEQAMAVAERLLTAISTKPIPTDEGAMITITASIGVTMLRDNDTMEDMLRRADRGLYNAKETGRNKVIKT